MENLKVARTFLLVVLAPSLITSVVRADDGDDVSDVVAVVDAPSCPPSTIGRVAGAVVSFPKNAAKAVAGAVVGAVRGVSCALCTACSGVANTTGNCLDAVANLEGAREAHLANATSACATFVKRHKRAVAGVTVVGQQFLL